ncbi:CbiM family transporter [Senegalia sp. (in: firmicutes)]|uniref:CbiM family transporter n=1 Tax=Senegalia sp. (in: firmicutes) TaxID=1924098 RepID=UPI003F9C919A
MHLADGVLSTPVIIATYALTAGAIYDGVRGIEDEEVPKIALMSGTFFAISLLSIPIGPSSVHPLLVGLIGIILGRRSALAFFPALLLQALLFRHGGLTALGANTIMLTIPAYICNFGYRKIDLENTFLKSSLIGALSVFMTVVILVGILFTTSSDFAAGDFSVINILIVSYLPLLVIEGLITGAAVQFLDKVKADWIAY